MFINAKKIIIYTLRWTEVKNFDLNLENLEMKLFFNIIIFLLSSQGC